MNRAIASATRLVAAAPRAFVAPVRRAMTTTVERPLSPHLSIYRFRVNMITSVFFRGTGIVLVAGLAGLSALGLAEPVGAWNRFVYHLQQHPVVYGLVKFGVVAPLVYHYLGGLRHLWWDSAQGQNMAFVKRTGWGATAIAGAAGLYAAFKSPCKGELH